MEPEGDIVCDRDAGQYAADVENKHCITVQICRDSPSSHPACFSLFSRIPCINIHTTAYIAVCSTVHTDSTHYAKHVRTQVSESLEREEVVTRREGEVQAMGDGGVSQHCMQPDHNTETNTIWKLEGVAVIVLSL